MARFYLGHDHHTQEESKPHGGTIKGSLQAGQDSERPDMLILPMAFGGGRDVDGKDKAIPLKKGGVAFGVLGHGFVHIGPGEYVDLPDDVPTSAVKSMCPQILTKLEAMRAGLCHEDGSMVPAKAKDAKPESKKPTT